MRKNPIILVFVAILTITALLFAGISVIPMSFEAEEETDVLDTRAGPSVSLNFQGEIDLGIDPQMAMYGAQGLSGMGEALGSSMVVGDINNDGENDLLVSALYAPIDRSGSVPVMGPGEVYVFYGRDRTAFPDEIDLASTVPDLLIRGNESEDKFGFDIAIANVNDDSYNDIIISAPERGILDGPPPLWISRANIGSVYIIFGDTKANLGTYRNMTKETDYDVLIQGDVEGEMIGHHIETGDLDKDGVDDLIITGPGMNRSFDKVGGLYILYGRSSWPPLIEFN